MSSGKNDELETYPSDANAAKIQALREMIQNAERTIHGAKAVLLQIEGKKKTGRPRKYSAESDEGTVVQGTFDGQFMTGADGKQYPVPANYASKSKLVEGDMLKLTITPDGSFIYKQIGPVERRHVIGIVAQDEHGNYQIVAENHTFRVLLASVTYFKLEPGDEVAILVPREGEVRFAAIENVLQKGAMVPEEALQAARNTVTAGEEKMDSWKEQLAGSATETPAVETAENPIEETEPVAKDDIPSVGPVEAAAEPTEEDRNILERWIRDMEALEKDQETRERTPADQA